MRTNTNQPEVILIYQDRDSVEPAIAQIKDLKLKFTAYKFHQKKLHEIAEQKPKILLLSSNDVKKTIQLYINYLEEYEQNIAPHSAILLINNRESAHAYLACENGLFDNYVIINPFNEPYRLKLVLLRELKLIENNQNDSLDKLISEGEDEFASCIEHGIALKNAFMQEVNKCESSLISTVHEVIDNNDVKAILENLINVSLNEMNGNISKTTQSIIDQLITLRKNNESIKQNIESAHVPKKKTVVGVNKNLLTSEGNEEKNPTLSYKVLIAEPSDLFSRVINEMFAETVFEYMLVNNGESALAQITEFNPDVILMAYDLPKLNGIEVTKSIREAGNKTPIIAYTHINDKKMIKRWIPLGLSSYIIKPSKKSVILKSITKALKEPTETIYHQTKADKDCIQWKPEYLIGNKEIDEQHKVLFTMINDFFLQDSKQTAISTFQNLASYIDLHFEAEENLLRQINYPKTVEHIKKHDELREKFQLLQQKLENYSSDLHQRISTFLYNWLASHILKSDMDYKSYALSIEEESFNQNDV
jgi:hemerythrin-like metal-binding protein